MWIEQRLRSSPEPVRQDTSDGWLTNATTGANLRTTHGGSLFVRERAIWDFPYKLRLCLHVLGVRATVGVGPSLGEARDAIAHRDDFRGDVCASLHHHASEVTPADCPRVSYGIDV